VYVAGPTRSSASVTCAIGDTPFVRGSRQSAPSDKMNVPIKMC